MCELVEAVRFLDILLIPPLGDEFGYVLGQGLALALDSLQVLTVSTEELFELIECFIFLRLLILICQKHAIFK